mgnify:CR=1 FL=1
MKKFFSLLLIVMAALQITYSQNLKTGDTAPDFTLPYATKDTIVFSGLNLSDALKGGKVILAFYPADWSGGCTKEVCSFRDNFTKLSDLNAQILGISGDYVFSHKEWAKHHDLQFKLLSDHDHSVAKKYESYNEKSGYNKRTVFVINEDKKIVYMDLDYKVNDDQDFIELTKALK